VQARPLAERPAVSWTMPIPGDAEEVKNPAPTAQVAAPCPANPHCQRDPACRLSVPSHHVGAFPASTRSAAEGQRETWRIIDRSSLVILQTCGSRSIWT